MKPKAQGPHDEGFLEYLEDIIGTNKYVEKIDESHKLLALFPLSPERIRPCNSINIVKSFILVCCSSLILFLFFIFKIRSSI